MGRQIQKMVGLFLIFALVSFGVPVKAAVENDLLRIGLTTSYAKKSSLTIADSQIAIGYCVNNNYTEIAELISETGFLFAPASEYYAKSDQSYGSYINAKMAAESIRADYKVSAWVGIFGAGEIYVLIGGDSNTSALATTIKKVQNSDLTFTAMESNNKQRVKMTGSYDSIIYDGKEGNGYPQIASVLPDNKLTIGTKQYRGRMEIGCYGNASVTAVNVVPMEQYLYGVIAAEMSSSWPEEALKAQAVVARTYAFHKGLGFGGDSSLITPYILNDTTSSQVYKGCAGETANTTMAVDVTSGEYIYYNGETIDATFFSTSGGATANSEDVWSSPVPYLQSVPDLLELEPEKEPWIMTFTNAAIKSKLSAQGQNIGTVSNIVEESRTDSGFLNSINIIGSTKTLNLQKAVIRSYFGTPSTKFKIISSKDTPDQVTVLSGDGIKKTKRISNCTILGADQTVSASNTSMEQFMVSSSERFSNYPKSAPSKADTYYFAGMGYGHGVGMSQSGAKGMAKAGYSYKEIIEHYYTGTAVIKK